MIDQYLILVEILIYNIADSRENDKLFLPFIVKAKDVIKNDNRITNIYNLINGKSEIDKFETNSGLFKCLNSYYCGNFSDSLELSKIGLINTPFTTPYRTPCSSSFSERIIALATILPVAYMNPSLPSSRLRLFTFSVCNGFASLCGQNN